jgi:hypothetical protein
MSLMLDSLATLVWIYCDDNYLDAPPLKKF